MALQIQLSQFPLWILITVLGLVFIALIISLRTGRQIQFWPPSIGPSIEKQYLEEQNRILLERLSAAQERYAALERQAQERYAALEYDLNSSQQRLKRTEEDIHHLVSELRETRRPFGSDRHVGQMLALFDRQAMKVLAHEEDFALMLRSLRDLRRQLQKAGVSTISNTLIRELFEKIKADLEGVEETIGSLAQSGIMEGSDILNAQMLFHELSSGERQSSGRFDTDAFRYGRRHRATNEFKEVHSFVESITKQAWRNRDYPHEERKEQKPQEMALAMTAMWLFGAIDRTRTNILNEIELLKNLFARESREF